MNILLTGAGGFIGSHLHKELNSEHKVFQVFHPSDYIEGKNSFSVLSGWPMKLAQATQDPRCEPKRGTPCCEQCKQRKERYCQCCQQLRVKKCLRVG